MSAPMNPLVSIDESRLSPRFGNLAPTVPSRVLIAVDFSEASREAVRVGAYLAGRLGAPLTLLHVIHDSVDAPGFYRDPVAEGPQRPIDAIAKDMGDEFLASMRREHPGLSALAQPDLMTVSGLPVTRIPEVCRFVCAGLLVIGSDTGTVPDNGSGTMPKWRRTLSQRLARNTSCSLLVVSAELKLPGYLDHPSVRHWLASDCKHAHEQRKIA